MLNILYSVDSFLSKNFHLPPHGLIDYIVLGLSLIFVLKFAKVNFLFSVSLFVLTIGPFLIHSIYYFYYGMPFSLFDIVQIKDLYYFKENISILLFVFSVLYLFILIRVMNKYIAIFILGLLSIGFLNNTDEDWNILEKYRKTGFYPVLLSEPFVKGLDLIDFYLLDASKKEFYLNESFNPNVNIYIGIFESFAVPGLLFDSKYKDLSALDYYEVNNSTFAGESARSEFEVLCGVPSFKEYGIEFNYINYFNAHNNLNCLPSVLKKYNYKSIAINAGRPYVFNTGKAYDKIGFSEEYFIKEQFLNYYLEDAPGEIIYDGHFLDFVKNIILESNDSDEKKLYYFFGLYGHQPYSRDVIKRPNVIDDDNSDVSRIINQFYYRNKEIENFLSFITEKDSDSIVILCGDHLPYIEGFKYINKNISYCYTKNIIDLDYLYDISPNILGITNSVINYRDEYISLLKGM